MRLKSYIYSNQQKEIINKLIEILNLKNINTFTLYDLDIDLEKQQKIMDLIPEIKKYYSCNSFKAVCQTYKIKRPYLSIIKQLLKNEYNIVIIDKFYQEINNIKIRTQKYIFENKV